MPPGRIERETYVVERESALVEVAGLREEKERPVARDESPGIVAQRPERPRDSVEAPRDEKRVGESLGQAARFFIAGEGGCEFGAVRLLVGLGEQAFHFGAREIVRPVREGGSREGQKEKREAGDAHPGE